MIKHFFIGILLLSMTMVCSDQEAIIDFYYNKQSNSIITHINNDTDNKMLIKNQGTFDQFSGSFILIKYTYDNKQSMRTIPLFLDTMKDGRIAPFKPLDSKQKLYLSQSVSDLKINNISKIELNLIILIIDKNTEKVTTQRYLKEVDIE